MLRKSRVYSYSIALALVVAASLLPSASAQFISGRPVYPLYDPLAQGGFEIPDQGSGFAYRPSGSAWSFAGGTGLAGNDSGFTSQNPPAPGGDQVLFIQGSNNAVVGQSVSYTVGRYRIRLKAAQRKRFDGTIEQQTVSVRLDGLEVEQITPPDDNYTLFVTDFFVLTAGSHLIEFVGLNPLGGDNTAFIDAVKVQSLKAISDDWSKPATWPSGSVPGPNDDVDIPAGQIVLLDTNAVVKTLTVNGKLYCKDKDISITTDWIEVFGLFECGTVFSPFVDDLTITLTGQHIHDAANPNGEPPTKHFRAMAGGTVELHGAPRVSWTQLGATAAMGDSSIVVADAVDWEKDDQIVIAPGHEAYNEGEVVTIAGVGVSGFKITLGAPGLTNQHYGEKSTYSNATTSWTLDERAEVGLLTRNILIQGDLASENDSFGGNMMAMVGSTVHVSGVEFYRMGQMGHLARYPFHWHVAGDVSGQYIANSSIHHSYSRCVTVHGANYALVDDNVCYDFFGHGYFLEDGIEEYNTFNHNLGIWAQKPAEAVALLETDYRSGTASNGPAVFWIGHPNNVFTNNAAAGSEGTGYWYGMNKEGPGGFPALQGTFGTFKDNRVHSSRQGFSSCSDPSGPWGMDPPNEALIENLTATNNGQGVWPCSTPQTQQNARFLNLIVANSQNGMQAPNPMTFEDSLFIGYTDNAPAGAQLGAGVDWRGIQVYDQGFMLDNVHFVNYDRPAMTAMFPGSGAHKHANNRAQGLSFQNAPHLFLDVNDVSYVGNGPARWGDVVHDLDGSFVGQDFAVVSDHPLMYDGTCYQPANIDIAGYACPYRYAHFRTENFTNIAPITIIRSDGYHNTSGHIQTRFINEFIMDPAYYYTYRYTQGMKHAKVQVHLRNAFNNDTAVYELLDVPSDFQINNGNWSSAASVTDLFNGAGHRYFYRDGSLFLKMLASGDKWHATDIVDVCMNAGSCSGVPNLGTLPSVTITSPADGDRVPSGNITVNANITDPDGIRFAKLYLGLTLIGTDGTMPFSWVMNNVPAGDYALKLVAVDAAGQTYTEVQQLFVGEPGSRIEITSHEDDMTFDAGTPLSVAYNLFNWPLLGGEHMHWFVNNVYQGELSGAGPLVVNNLTQGRQEIKIGLAQADHTVKAINDIVRLYAMENNVIADFEDGVDHRGSLFPNDSNMGPVTAIKFAWGTADPVASRADNQDDINYYDVFNDGNGVDSYATYRLTLNPPQDWSGFTSLQIKASASLDFECFAVDASQGSTSLGMRAGNTTTLNLSSVNATLIDEVVAIDLRYYESTIPVGGSERQHLQRIKLIP